MCSSLYCYFPYCKYLSVLVNGDLKSSVKSLVYIIILNVLNVYLSLVYINEQIIPFFRQSYLV